MQVQFLLARRGKRERPLVEQWCVFFPLMLLDRFHSTNIKAWLHIATLSLDRRCEGFSLFQIKAARTSGETDTQNPDFGNPQYYGEIG